MTDLCKCSFHAYCIKNGLISHEEGLNKPIHIKNMLPQSPVIMISVNDNLSYNRYIVGIFGSAGSFPVIFYSSIT